MQVLDINAAAEFLQMESGKYLFYVVCNLTKMRKADDLDQLIIERLEEDVFATLTELQDLFGSTRASELLNEGLIVGS